MSPALLTARLTRHDKIVLLLWLVTGLVGASIAYKYFFRAFPEASVEFKVSRADALRQAREFASAQGGLLDGYQSSIIFDVDDTAKTYLEREVGLQQADRMMGNDVRIWYWQTRFFRPLQKEEFDVRLGTAGGIVGYTHVLDETAAGARLERVAAQFVAESFLRDTVHLDLGQYDLRTQEANSTERPNRRDWSFVWERHGFRAKDAPYEVSVSLAGDLVDGYAENLKVPEAWKLGYERLRSTNNLIEYIALIPYSFLLGGCLYVIFSLGRRGLLDARSSLIFGAFLTAIFFVMTMNQWPLDRAAYDTNTPYSSFFLNHVGQAMLLSIVSALLAVLAFAPGEFLYRAAQPAKLQLRSGLALPGIRTKEFFIANVIGICLAAAHIGYITVFYIVGGKHGVWAPQDLNYTNVVSTSLPWVYPLAIGIYAATSEEFLFRLFAIPFLQRITKSRLLAVVLPAFAWGFLHSNYPQQPAYIRGIEVGLIGIVAGLVMLRWGIWATLIWHYTVDAFLISTSLLRSSDSYLRVSGALVGGAALIPLAIAAFSYITRGVFEVDSSLLNSARPLTESLQNLSSTPWPSAGIADALSPAAGATVSGATVSGSTGQKYSALRTRELFLLAGAGVLGLALLIGVKPRAIGDFVRFPINATEATARADQVLRGEKLDPATYHHLTTIVYTFDPYINEYLRRTIGIPAANGIYADRSPAAFWTTRYFRDSENEEYNVILRTDGQFHSLHHTLDEKASGASLSKEDALLLAEANLRNEKHIDLSLWKLVETSTDKRPARTDHLFEWEQKAALDQQATPGRQSAYIRMQIRVQGQEVSGYRVFVKIPTAWRDLESRTTAAQIAQSFGRIAAIALVLITMLVVFFRSLKNSEIAQVPWRRIGTWSVLILFAAIVIFVNRAPQLLANYTTAWPLITFYAILSISLLFGVALYFAAGVLFLGLAQFFVERALGHGRMPSFAGMPPAYYRDAFCIATFGTTATLGLGRLPALLARWPMVRHSLGATAPDGLDTLFPAAGAIASSIVASVGLVGLLGITVGLIAYYIRPFWMRCAVAIFVAVVTATDAATPGTFVREAAFRLLAIAILWVGVTRIGRFNVVGYFLLGALMTLVPACIELIEQPSSYFKLNGFIVLATALLLLAVPLFQWSRSGSTHGLDSTRM